VVAVIAGEGGAAASAPAPASSAPKPPATPAAAVAPPKAAVTKPSGPRDPFFEVRTPSRNFGPAKTAGGAHVTPLARRLAGESGIDLSRMTGSGPHGRIVASDVEAAIAKGGGRSAPMATGMSAAQVKALYADAEFEE